MTDIIRITPHPTDHHLAYIHAGPTLAAIMGQLPHARYQPQHKAYLIHTDAIPSLHALAQHHHIHITDQRRSIDPRGQPQPQECRHCAHPGSWSHPPRWCPECGQDWDPIAPPTDNPIHISQTITNLDIPDNSPH